MNVTIFRDYKEDAWKSMEIYSDNLVHALKNNYNSIHIKEYYALSSISKYFPKRNKIIRYIFRYLLNPIFSFFNQGDINHIIDQSNAHLIHVLNPNKTVITCHDLIVPVWENEMSRISSWGRIKSWIKYWRIHSLKKAKYIITVSQYSKKQLIDRLHIDPHRVTVIPEGVENIFMYQPKEKSISIKNKDNLPAQFVLHVGSCAPYKNINFLLHLFHQIAHKNPQLYLVKVGSTWTDDQYSLIKKLGIEKRILTVSHVPKADLPHIYSLATCLIHPSYIEGFGLTVLEAMACRCPVILSDIPVLHELAGNAGIYIPNNVTAAASRVQKILISKKLQRRHAILGEKRSKYYTWDHTAQLSHRLYVTMKTI
jgi:glycosyltransferase involved in cell wall biosynthesis